MIIQLPIWIGFYRAIIRTMPTTPEGMANLSEAFYSWNPASADVPLNRMFLGIDLADNVSEAYLPLNLLLPVLVGASMFITTKMTSMSIVTDERQQQQQRIMQWMMPIMIGVFTYQFPSGLGIYILLSNVVGVVIQYYVGGKQPIDLFGRLYLGTAETRAFALEQKATQDAGVLSADSENEEDTDDEPKDIHGKERTRGNRRRTRSSRRRVRRRRH